MVRTVLSALYLHSALRSGPAAAMAALTLSCIFAAPASAQTLDAADYEICSVYDRNDSLVGYDNVCLERRSAALRRLRARNRDVYQDTVLCPWHANGGQGYKATFYTDGRSPSLFGNWDSTWDGRPCVSRGRPVKEGYP